MTEETKQAEYRIERWAYAGQRTTNWTTGAVSHRWIVMVPGKDGSLVPGEKFYTFDSILTRGVMGRRQIRIGGLWDMQITDREGGISVATGGEHAPKPVDVLHGPEVVRWEAENDTALAFRDARAAASKLMAGSELADLLAPIRVAYRDAQGAQRAALLAAIIAEITAPFGGLPGKPAKSKAKGRK